jgi:hypothetical protein
MVEIRQMMWIVMLESTKDRVLGVDTPGQQVLACLLIRGAVGRVPCSDD